MGPAGAGDDPEEDLGLTEGGVVGGDAEVAGEGDLAPTPERVSCDRRDRRLGDPGERAGEVLQAVRGADHVDIGHRLHLLDVGTGREHLLAAIDDHGGDVVPLARLGRGCAEFLLDLQVQCVHRRPVEPDGADPVLDVEADELTHGGSTP